MSYSAGSSIVEVDFSTLKKNWGWTVAFGLLLSLAGAIALGSVTLTTISSVFLVGAAMIASGVVEIAHGFAMRSWRKFFLWLAIGALYIVAGVGAIQNPLLAAGVFTLMIGISLIGSGLARGYLAFQLPQNAPRIAIALSGLLSLLLGAVILVQWPVSSLWVIGAFLGVDLFFAGMSWVGVGVSLKNA
jgi:aquaporin Z